MSQKMYNFKLIRRLNFYCYILWLIRPVQVLVRYWILNSKHFIYFKGKILVIKKNGNKPNRTNCKI
jgi:hypothetical protein